MIESEPVRILLVEDDEVDRMAVQRLFANQSLPYELVMASTVAEATSRLREGGIGLALIDHRLPDGTGLDVQQEAPRTPSIFITAADDLSIAVEAMKAGAADFIVKDNARQYLQLLPLTIESTLKQAEHVQARWRAEEALQRAHDELEAQVRQRTAELEATVDKLNMQIDVRKRAEAELNSLTVSLEERVAERTAVAERRAGDLRRLTAELSQAEHRERKRLAKLLHDELQQTLWAVRLRLAKIGRGVKGPLRTELEATIEMLNECVATSCDLTVQLTPPILSVGTLREVLEWLGRWFEEKHGLTVAVDTREPIPPVPERLRASLFQAVRELLFNTVKHSGVMEARVALSSSDGRLAVQVEDAGKDFDARAVRQKLERPLSFGLLSVRERVEFLGGRMEIETMPSGGACFRLMVPVEATAEPPSEEVQTAHDGPRLPAAEERQSEDCQTGNL